MAKVETSGKTRYPQQREGPNASERQASPAGEPKEDIRDNLDHFRTRRQGCTRGRDKHSALNHTYGVASEAFKQDNQGRGKRAESTAEKEVLDRSARYQLDRASMERCESRDLEKN